MRRSRFVGHLTLAATLVALALTASTSPAAASLTLGQLAPTSGDVATVSADAEDRLQPTVTSGNGYVVPATGGITAWTVTSWSTIASGDAVQMAMKMFRKLADPATYTVVGHDGPRFLTPGVVNTFTASIAVKPGDVLGVGYPGGSNVAPCCFDVPGEHLLTRPGFLADGQSGDFSLASLRVNVTAVLVPLNAFTPGSVKRNKKKGTATLTVNVPNPGELTGSGNGAKVASAGRAAISKAVSPGNAQLLIKAKGKKQRKLDERGKVKLNVAVTYTPTGGDPSTQSLKVKLKKKL